MSWGGNGVEAVAQNRLNYLTKTGLDPARAVSAEQVHGTAVKRVTEGDAGRGVLDPKDRLSATDGLVTNVQGIILTTLHADCAPIFYRDARNRVIGLAHAGWRGILDGLPGKMLEVMEAEFGSAPRDIEVSVGPMICAEHYPVTPERAGEFQRRFGPQTVIVRSGQLHLDLYTALIAGLLGNGLSPDRIPARPPCTYSDPQYPSYRRDGPPARSMMAWMVIV